MDIRVYEELLGKTITKVGGLEKGSDSITLTFSNGEAFEFYHEQDCCESVSVEDVTGDPNDLVGEPLVMAEEIIDGQINNHGDSQTWTFYKFATSKGYVTVRWLGESNGYYSERVDFRRIADGRH